MLPLLGNRQTKPLSFFSPSCWPGRIFLVLSMMSGGGFSSQVSAQPSFPVAESSETASRPPLEVTAERVKFDQVAEVFQAIGSVVITQGPLRLTADEATIHKLSGALNAKGAVHLIDQFTEIWAEELELNVYTEAGVITNGRIFLRDTKTWVRGRLFQRFSESHIRVKDGSFTNWQRGTPHSLALC